MKNKTILIADDSDFDRNLLSGALARTIGCKIVKVNGGEAALHALATQAIDLVILDVEMDGMSGDVVVSKIRASSGLADLPIIMVSGKSQDSIVIDCLNAGANDYISKPINFMVAITRIQNHLKMSDAIADRAKLLEVAAINSMVVTYNQEISTPLTIALMNLTQLKETVKEDSKDGALLHKIERALIKIAEIVKGIREVAEKNKIPKTLEPVEITKKD